MKTYFLGQEEVRAYARDFVSRVKRFPNAPTIWCPITESGDELLTLLVSEVAASAPELLASVRVIPIDVNGSGPPRFAEDGAEQAIAGQRVLLLDGAIHSGRMMNRCADLVLASMPAELASYALAIKRCSVFIPTLWGIMIEETDRIYFLLDEIPNNRLDAGDNRPQQYIHVQLLEKSRLPTAPVVCGVSSIDRMTWGDRLFQMETSDSDVRTFVMRHGRDAVGFLTVHSSPPSTFVIDEVAIDESRQKNRYGGVLMRLADTLARHADSYLVRLNALSTRVSYYEGFGFSAVPGSNEIELGDEKYQPMQRAILYHVGLR